MRLLLIGKLRVTPVIALSDRTSIAAGVQNSMVRARGHGARILLRMKV